MGLFDSKTKKETTNINDQRTYADYSETGGSKSSVILDLDGDENTLNMLDYGAVNSSYDFAGKLVDQMNKGQQAIVDSLSQSTMKTYGLAQSAITEAQRSETENISINLMKWGGLVAVVISVAMIFKKGKK